MGIVDYERKYYIPIVSHSMEIPNRIMKEQPITCFDSEYTYRTLVNPRHRDWHPMQFIRYRVGRARIRVRTRSVYGRTMMHRPRYIPNSIYRQLLVSSDFLIVSFSLLFTTSIYRRNLPCPEHVGTSRFHYISQSKYNRYLKLVD